MINAIQKDFYDQHGVVFLPNILNEAWLKVLKIGFAKNIANPGPHACHYTEKDSPQIFRDDYCNWQNISEFKKFIFSSPLAEIAARLTNSEKIYFFHEHIFYKKKGTQKKTPWHQDLPYYIVDGTTGISFWIPLTSIDHTNKLEFISKSKTKDSLFEPKKFSGQDVYNVPRNLYEEIPPIDRDPKNFPILSWPMKPGDVLAFSFTTLHGNQNNPEKSLKDRKCIAFRFFGDDMRFSKRPGEKSPPFNEINFSPGEKARHEIFPKVWPKN